MLAITVTKKKHVGYNLFVHYPSLNLEFLPFVVEQGTYLSMSQHQITYRIFRE